MEDGLDVVAVRVADQGAVVALVVLRVFGWGLLLAGAGGQRGVEERIDRGAGVRDEGDVGRRGRPIARRDQIDGEVGRSFDAGGREGLAPVQLLEPERPQRPAVEVAARGSLTSRSTWSITTRRVIPWPVGGVVMASASWRSHAEANPARRDDDLAAS